MDRTTGVITIVTLEIPPQPETLTEKFNRLSEENLSLMTALAEVYEQLLTLNSGGGA
ncbi:hypothetical protein D3C86_1995390 [compost metagenome]